MKSNAVAIALAGLAVVIAAGGTAYAVTASKVNIADVAHPTRTVTVNTNGQLLTTGATSTIDADGAFYGFDLPAVYAITTVTRATLAVSAIDVDNSRNHPEPNTDFQATLVKIQVGSSGTCADSDHVITQLSSYAAPSGQSAGQSFPEPIVVKPAAGKGYCLGFQLTSIDSTEGSSLYPTYMTIDGYVVSGTYTGAGTDATQAHKLPTKLRHA